jgi:5-methyltetrahydrofolate--homocysteine methyltransferase
MVDDVRVTWQGKTEVFHFHRQQRPPVEGRGHLCLADFIAPESSKRSDALGGFAVTAGREIHLLAAEFERQHDDYSSIIVKILGDRLAEATAEWLHAKVRRELWGYAADEVVSMEDIFAMRYRGTRPAHGYPACPDHRERLALWRMLDVEKEIGAGLTESCMMTPPCSVSGLMFAHPESRYFSVGPVGDDQLADYERRRGR